MLVDLSFFASHIVPIIGITVGVLVLKSVVASITARAVGLTLRSAILAGFALSQVGEFSFLLSKAGLSHGLLEPQMYQMFLAITVLTMGASPVMMAMSNRLARFATSRQSFASPGKERDDGKENVPDDHLLIIGFGLNGKNLSMAASRIEIPHSIIEMNPDTVKKEQAKGVPIFYGDATNEEVLRHGGGGHARVAVVAINDPSATRRIVELLRRINPKLSIIVRTRFVKEVKPLYTLGASDVIPEEFETSIEIFTRVMRKYLLSRQDIDRFTTEIRSEAYEVLRSPSPENPSLEAMRPLFGDVEVSVFDVQAGSMLAGKSLKEAELRTQHSITVLSIQRGDEQLANPDGNEKMQPDDKLLAMGKPINLTQLAVLLADSSACTDEAIKTI